MGYKNAQQAVKNTVKPPETRSEEIGQDSGFQMDDQFEAFDASVIDNIIDLRGARIMQQVIVRISLGDMGKIAPLMLKSFEQGTLATLGEQVKQLREWHETPLRALPPADMSKIS